jgi:hypothetical protein
MIGHKYEITQRFDELLRSLVNAMFAANRRILEIPESMQRACDHDRRRDRRQMLVTQITYVCMNCP